MCVMYEDEPIPIHFEFTKVDTRDHILKIYVNIYKGETACLQCATMYKYHVQLIP